MAKIKEIIAADVAAVLDMASKSGAALASHQAATDADAAYAASQSKVATCDSTLAAALVKTGPVLSTVTNADGTTSAVVYETDNTAKGWHTISPVSDDTDVPDEAVQASAALRR